MSSTISQLCPILGDASVDFSGAVPTFTVYSVAGSIFQVVAIVLLLAAVSRAVSGPHSIVSERHIDGMCKVILVSGTVVGYAYCMELFMAYYSGSKYEGAALLMQEIHGPTAWIYYLLFFCTVLAPQTFWFKKARKSLFWVVFVSICVSMGMGYERYFLLLGSWQTD